MRDHQAIEILIDAFFSVFDNHNGRLANFSLLHEICLPECQFIRTCGEVPEVQGLEDFIAPRKQLLESGDLVDFSEREEWGRTDLFGDMAHRHCVYSKSGMLNGEPYVGNGVKSIQMVRMPAGWRIASVLWDDERQGLIVPDPPDDLDDHFDD